MNIPAAMLSAFLLSVQASADNGMELGLSMPYARTAVEGRPIISISWFTGQITPFPGYGEYGFVAMLPTGDKKPSMASTPMIADFAGMYAGQLFLPAHGLIRPGFNLGWLWEEKSYSTVQGENRSQRNFSLYYAFKVQFSCLTFIASNKGVGGGFNFSI